jgi:hypothetical protein
MAFQSKGSLDMSSPRTSSSDNHSPDIVKIEETFPDIKSPPPNQVNWDGENDPQNPVNWGASVKWKNLGVISAMAFVT